MKVLQKRFHLNGHTIGFHPQTQKLKLHTKQLVQCESTAEEVSSEWSYHRISSTNSKVRTIWKRTVPCESTTEEDSFEWIHHRISSTDPKASRTT